jgi:acyl-CoA dehydrogenase
MTTIHQIPPLPAAEMTTDPLELARAVRPVLEREAAAVDDGAVFPEAGLAMLRSSGLMGLMVPRRYGGLGGSAATMSAVTRELAEGCMSTAMVWGMHCQQVAAVVGHASEGLREDVLPRIAAGDTYIASVTSERGKGGHLLTALAPLEQDGPDLVVRRDAPIVTGGLHADAFLITMRASADAPPSDVALVWADRSQLEIEARANWNPMGARGTHSVALELCGRVQRGNLVGEAGFRDVALRTFVPVGHIAWSSAWLGAATGALRKMLAVFRDPRMRRDYDLKSDLFATRLARIRLELGVVHACLRQALDSWQELCHDPHADSADFEHPRFQLAINELKIVASERLFAAVDQLIELSGLRHGYLRSSPVALERTFRDLRSASLMYGNDRLLVANGKLALLDREISLR